ncbi:MAG TPA: hypothetical protein VF172_11055 [Nitrososphaera sp.]
MAVTDIDASKFRRYVFVGTVITSPVHSSSDMVPSITGGFAVHDESIESPLCAYAGKAGTMDNNSAATRMRSIVH